MTAEQEVAKRLELYLDEELAGADPSVAVMIADISAIIRSDERERLAKLAKGDTVYSYSRYGDMGLEWSHDVASWLRRQVPRHD